MMTDQPGVMSDGDSTDTEIHNKPDDTEIHNKPDDGAGDEEANDTRPPCKKHYDNLNGSKKVLMAMLTGLSLKDDEGNPDSRILGDLKVEPYRSTKNKKLFKPGCEDLIAEIYRRVEVLGLEEVRAANWRIGKTMKWLFENKIISPDDIAFLREEERKFYDNLVAAEEERIALQSLPKENGPVWSENADLRMVHCLLEDDIREAFFRRHDVMARDALDGRNSPHRPKTFKEKLADKFNSTEFSPHSEVFPDLHEDFAESFDLSLSNCPCEVSPEQVSW